MYNFLLVDASQSVSCQCACSVERLPRLFFLFPWLPRMAEALQSKTQGKKELVERDSVDLALGVRGCTKGVQRSIEK